MLQKSAFALLLLSFLPFTFAQTISSAQHVQLSIPFGTVEGSLLLLGGQMIFVDHENPRDSFVIGHDGIQSLAVEGGVLTVTTKQPVRDRSGERRQFAFKLSEAATGDAFAAWSKSAPPPASGTASADSTEPLLYNVKHQHFPRGECTGRLRINKDGLTYESVDNASHSRQWQAKDIREAKRSNPYELNLEPFDGRDYKFVITQRGMSSAEFQKLVDFITAARMAR
jgi:hypothetical protein